MYIAGPQLVHSKTFMDEVMDYTLKFFLPIDWDIAAFANTDLSSQKMKAGQSTGIPTILISYLRPLTHMYKYYQCV